MTDEEYRVCGKMGSDPFTVYTQWFDDSRGVVEGIMLGLSVKGWEDTEVESRVVESNGE